MLEDRIKIYTRILESSKYEKADLGDYKPLGQILKENFKILKFLTDEDIQELQDMLKPYMNNFFKKGEDTAEFAFPPFFEEPSIASVKKFTGHLNDLTEEYLGERIFYLNSSNSDKGSMYKIIYLYAKYLYYEDERDYWENKLIIDCFKPLKKYFKFAFKGLMNTAF